MGDRVLARGVEDIFITATDNLNGFTDTIRAVFPQSTIQICMVHQIRNACKYIGWKERKAFTVDMRDIYTAPNKEAAKVALDALDQKWGGKYSCAIISWRKHWEELTAFLELSIEIRRIIYTTNTIENLSGKIRKYTKNKLSYPTDEAVIKSALLAIKEATQKWTLPIRDWGLILNQFILIFEGSLHLD